MLGMVLSLGVIVALVVSYKKYEEKIRQEDTERIFNDLVRKLNRIGEDIFKVERKDSSPSEAQSRNWENDPAPISAFLLSDDVTKKKSIWTRIAFREIGDSHEMINCLYKTKAVLFSGAKVGYSVLCDTSIDEIAEQLHAAAELFRKSYPEIKDAKEKIEARGDTADPESVALELKKQVQMIILKNFVADFKKKKLGC